MKTLVLCSILAALVSGLSVSAAAEPRSKEVNIAVNDVFIPEVANRNTDVKIILTGMFPNSCYSWSRADVKSPSEINHEIKAMAMVTTNTMCLMVLIPYSKEVNLGRLQPGEHSLRFISGDETYFERKLVVQ